MRPEELPDTKAVEIEELKRRLGEGVVYVLAERVAYGFGGLASNVGADLTLEILERLGDKEKSKNIVRENGKKTSAPVEVFEFSSEREKRSFLEEYGQAVTTLERLLPLAKEFREGLLSDVSRINDQLRFLIRVINLEKKELNRKLEEKQRLGNLLSDRELRANIYKNLISPACENPAVLLYFSYNPVSFEHATDVSSATAAIIYRAAKIRAEKLRRELASRDVRNKEILESQLREAEDQGRLEQKLEAGVKAALLHDVGDDHLRAHNIKEGSETYRKIFPIRDFVIPRRMFTIESHEERTRNFIGGISDEEVEAIENHHTPRYGRVVDFGMNRVVAFIPAEIYSNYERNPSLWSRVLMHLEREKSGELQVEYIRSDLHQSLYLAELWITGVGHNATKLNAATQYKRLKSTKGLSAREDLVDALLGIVEEKYFKS